jgi:microcystin degradation protein MlrC
LTPACLSFFVSSARAVSVGKRERETHTDTRTQMLTRTKRSLTLDALVLELNKLLELADLDLPT